MSEFYEGRQFVGMDLHRRRSVVLGLDDRIGRAFGNGAYLQHRRSVGRCDVSGRECPEVVLEATYGPVLGGRCVGRAGRERASR